VTATSVEKVNGTPVASPEPRFDPVALAEAEAIRTRAAAEVEAEKIKAQGEAKAAEILAAEQAQQMRLENEKQSLANERAALRFRREEAEQLAKIAEADKKREDTERVREAARRQNDEQQQAEADAAKEIADADDKWRAYAIRFAIVCGIVSLPVQMSFFWNPHAPWMAAAPIMLEGAAWVVHRGARAAAVSKRPVWHYRVIVWLLALIAAAINLYHGLHSFDPGTALATAFASIAGPGVWDLHEHGRLRKRDGVLTRRERKAAKKEADRIAKEKAAEEASRKAEKEAANKAAAEAAKQLAADREQKFPKVWDHAKKLAADLGETTITEAIWKRAKLDVDGALPGESAEVFRMRNAAEMRVEAARQKRPVSTLSKTANAQRVPHLPPGFGRGSKTGPKVRGVRRSGDAPKFSDVARKQARIERTETAQNDRPSAN